MIVREDKKKLAQTRIEAALMKRELAGQLIASAERELCEARMLMEEIENEKRRIATAGCGLPRNDREGDDAHE